MEEQRLMIAVRLRATLPYQRILINNTKQQQQPKFQYYYYPHSSQYQSNNSQYFPACTCQCCQQQQQQLQQQQTTGAAPPLPKSQPPYENYIGWNRSHFGGLHQESDKSFFSSKDQWPNAFGYNQQPQQPKQPYIRQHQQQQQVLDNGRFYAANSATTTTTNYSRAIPQSFHIYITNNNNSCNNNNNTTCTNTSDFVRHVTRVNFYDVDTSQVEFESKDNHYDDNEQQLDTEAITKEEEWITKRKTELTTTRQIETRVKRQVVLEDGKVVEDSGPIVSTNTTEDTDKQETETTEKRDLGLPQQQNLNGETLKIDATANGKVVAEFDDGAGGKVIKKMVARPLDGLVRESNEKRVISHEEVKDYLETEAIQHYGDFSDETYVKAVNSGAENLENVLLSSASKQQLATVGPRIVKQTTQSRKTIDSENTQKRSLAQEDGTLVTESKTTTEHEIIADEDIPEEKIPKSLTQNKEILRESKQRYFKQRDEQNVDLVVDGQVIDSEMRYAAETAHMEKEGSLERPDDWDSLSDRMRKMRSRTHQKTLMQQHKAALLADRKDALTKRPLDFDREEETRKGETMKWLESHFGSESTASNDSREEADAELEPTKKTYFNVTIKSNAGATNLPATHTLDRKTLNSTTANNNNTSSSSSKYYQGISNWAERKEVPLPPPAPPAKVAATKHFSSKAFRDDLQQTVARNRLRRNDSPNDSRERLAAEPKDTYVSREDILQQKRQSLTAQYLARQRRGSREQLDEPDHSIETKRPVYQRANTMDLNRLGARQSPVHAVTRQHEYLESRAKSYDRELNDSTHYESRTLKPKRRSPTPENLNKFPQSSTLGRPTVPQRRRVIEHKLRQQQTNTPLKLQVDAERSRAEPPPDYSPPPRSRSSSPDYSRTRAHREYREVENSTLQRKQNQRTRFAASTPPTQPLRQSMATQTPASNISTSTTATQKSSRRVSQVIGNSLRKLVSKIRSASAERKLKRKTKSKSREQSPAAASSERRDSNSAMPTYQQYNVIDSHIGGQTNGSNESERESVPVETGHKLERERERERERESVAPNSRRGESADSDKEHLSNPRQRYYLGEDPYSSTLYGKENIYDSQTAAKRQREVSSMQREIRRDETDYHRTTPYTLGRYQKATSRIAGSTPNLSHTQTLPRKLHEQQKQAQTHYQYQKRQTANTGYTTLGHPERRTTPLATGPAKPARTYAKALNRSRSFSVHGMNGHAEPSTTYVEKMNRYNHNNNLQASQAYKSNPHLYSSGNVPSKESSNMLKSPSIVNLISRSQRDLSKIEDDRLDERKNEMYQATTYYKTLPAVEKIEEYVRKPAQYQLRAKHSLPVELNKDTASIIRRENEYNNKLHEKRTLHTYRDEQKRRGSGATIIDIRHK